MAMIIANGLEDLSDQLGELSDGLVVLYFYIEDSAECTQVNDAINELLLTADGSNVVAVKIHSAKGEEICKKYEISSVPAVIFILEGKVKDTLVGANVPALSKKFDEYLKSLKESMDNRLKTLINKSPVMLFMKGSPSAPRCGFSKQVIALLNSHNANFETFDILEDYDVREALKKFSNWPTYPQLYVKGELIGGLDILKELSESGELDGILSG